MGIRDRNVEGGIQVWRNSYICGEPELQCPEHPFLWNPAPQCCFFLPHDPTHPLVTQPWLNIYNIIILILIIIIKRRNIDLIDDDAGSPHSSATTTIYTIHA